MFGWFIGTAHKKILLVKISFCVKNIKNLSNIVIDNYNATYCINNFAIDEITDEHNNHYISVDANIIINELLYEKKNLKKYELYENTNIFFYIDKMRALNNIYLFNNRCTGIFKQYLSDGTLQGEITMENGKMNGICKNYFNGVLIEEFEYKKNVKDGLCKKYNYDKKIIEINLYKNGIIVN